MLSIEHERIQLSRLPKAFDGFRIVQLSDIHHGPFSSTEQIERAVDTANRLKPDIIALTGDYISKERHYAAPCAEMLGAESETWRLRGARQSRSLDRRAFDYRPVSRRRNHRPD
jgi:3',5'-cyclic AMP phosphodiesterase CpdA